MGVWEVLKISIKFLMDGRCHEQVDIRSSVADGLLGTLTPLTWEISRNLFEGVKLVAHS